MKDDELLCLVHKTGQLLLWLGAEDSDCLLSSIE